MSRTDTECVELSLDGHPEAFEQLVECYWAPLLSYLAGRLGDSDRAEEAVQEAFVRSFMGLKGLKKPESFFSWLFGIADRVVKEQWRDERRRAEVLKRAPTQRSHNCDQWNGMRVDRMSQRSHDYDLESAVAQLPEPYRQVLLLRYYGNLSCGQVAERLAVPLGTVTKRLSRAYAMLRTLLEGDGLPEEKSEVQS
jgi:RNA polymerase sigma-70 factor (ECF subfamily)